MNEKAPLDVERASATFDCVVPVRVTTAARSVTFSPAFATGSLPLRTTAPPKITFVLFTVRVGAPAGAVALLTVTAILWPLARSSVTLKRPSALNWNVND